MKKGLILALIFIFSVAQSQEKLTNAAIKKTSKEIFLDSLKSTFIHDETASCIDSLWMKELTSFDLYNEMLLDIKNINVDEIVDFELPTELLKKRLKKLDQKSPFNIEYNQGLENVIKSFLKNRKKTFERLMGISQYYFPIFEEELAKNNIPLEIKYLAVVESALNPRAVSRVGATGLWQFMYHTGKQYDLEINSYVDERSEPIKSSQAASLYMNNMYKIFGDWDLVLASYNSGPGNVSKAIRRSGGQQNYWNIRKNLPKETQGYLPAFLATMYIFEYHKEHGLVPNKAVANHFTTDTIAVKSHITFKQISELLDISLEEIKFFNPSYKRNEIPYISGEINFLRLPKDKIAIFTSNEDKIYAYVEYEETLREKPFETAVVSRDSINDFSSENKITRTKYYKVKRGDSLGEISEKYGVSVSSIKKWNHLRSNKLPRGKRLKIYVTESLAYKTKNEKAVETNLKDSSKVAQTQPNIEKTFKIEKTTVLKSVTKKHKIKRGDNLGEIASKYDVTVADIKKWNRLKSNTLPLGNTLKIIKEERVVINVKKEIKSEEFLSPKTNKDTLKYVSRYHVVSVGEQLSDIAKANHTTTEVLKEWNNLKDKEIEPGDKIIVGKMEEETEENISTQKKYPLTQKEKLYYVRKGDSLFSISQKFPGVTISDIKKRNNIKDGRLKPGMKLIIGG